LIFSCVFETSICLADDTFGCLYQAKLAKLQDLGLTGRSPALDDEMEGIPNPVAVSPDTGATIVGSDNFLLLFVGAVGLSSLCHSL
jgi:hypothetical protein